MAPALQRRFDVGAAVSDSVEQFKAWSQNLSHEDVMTTFRSYGKALDIARSQAAKIWELHAATRLARLWVAQRKPAEAHGLLAPFCGWFTKGFETADLKEAKALLEELG